MPRRPLNCFASAALLICIGVFHAAVSSGSEIEVKHKEGLIHGFLLLSTLEGNPLANGDLIQTAQGDEVTIRLAYHFKDGSLQDETTVFTQNGKFRLVRYHIIQKGPAFPRTIEMTVIASSGQVTVHYTDGDGKEKDATEHMKLPPDLANGLVLTFLKNLGSDTPPVEVGMIVATPKPRLVRLAISPEGSEPFSLGAEKLKATRYVVKVEIGGVAGLLAPLLGKQPTDSHIWILGGKGPAFVKSEVLSYFGGPMWRTELAVPVWPRPATTAPK